MVLAEDKDENVNSCDAHTPQRQGSLPQFGAEVEMEGAPGRARHGLREALIMDKSISFDEYDSLRSWTAESGVGAQA